MRGNSIKEEVGGDNMTKGNRVLRKENHNHKHTHFHFFSHKKSTLCALKINFKRARAQ